jgi:hypothetical protein
MTEHALYGFQTLRLAVVMGTSEIASAVAVALTGAGYGVAMIHDPYPPVIRRGMAFHDALYDDPVTLGGVVGERAEHLLEIAGVLARRARVAVTPLSLGELLAYRAADILVDARMQKDRITPDFRRLARLTIGMGPKFAVGVNCDIAIETRPSRAGAVLTSGETEAADGKARELGSVGRERFVYSDRDGVWRTPMDVGMWVPKNFVIGRHDGFPIRAPLDGHLRGVARDGAIAPARVKLVEIDPRGRESCWTGTDARGLELANACVRAIELQPERAQKTMA